MIVRRWLSTVFVLAVPAALLTPAASTAQSTYRYPYAYGFNQGHYPYYYSNVYPYSYLYPPPETSVHYQPRYQAVYYPGLGFSLRYQGTGTSSPLWNSYQAFAPSAPRVAGTTSDHTVVMDVRVPDPDAEVWIDGHRTTQKGLVRRFVSPPLDPGRTYRYEVRAQWVANGRRIDQTQPLTIEAGHHISIDFFPVTASR